VSNRLADDVAQREIATEQHYVDAVYLRLDEAAKAAQALAVEGHGRARLGHEGGLVERDAMVYQAARRIAALDAAHEGLVFGRLDLVDGQARYVGRIGLRDADREVMLIDWRAPAAAVFYRATAQEPSGVVRRRVLRCQGSTVIGVEDDLLNSEAAPDGMAVVGEGALLAQLSRARDSQMHSVVATIQKEQDEAIRAPSRGVTNIAGGPGTGKTVVALHRAAYLLYTDRRRFEHGGVLVVGPSAVFMSYIARVLPSLGETSVTLRSVGDVVDGVTATRHDLPEVAAIKGSDRMRRVLARAVRDGVPGGPESFGYFYRDDRLLLDPLDLRRLRGFLLSGGQRRNRAVGKVDKHLLDRLWRQVRGERGRERGKEDFVDVLTSSPEFGEFVGAWWPPLNAVEVWQWLHDSERLRSYAGSDLEPSEVEALLRSWRSGFDPSIEDVPLIDELRYLLGDVPDDAVLGESDDDFPPRQPTSFEREEIQTRLRVTARTEDDSYAHVLLDEAQDLSPMQWRMVGRRGRYASWTIVGDPAQSSWPLPHDAELARAEALRDKPEHAFRLSTNYRNSAEIFDLAAKVARLAVADPDLPQAVRRTGVPPRHRVVAAGELAEAIRASLRAVAHQVPGTVAVVTSGQRRPEVAPLLAGELDVFSERVFVLGALDTKGLEFDGVVVVEPAEIAAESSAGWRTLYVVLTRATQRLVTVSTNASWLTRLEG